MKNEKFAGCWKLVEFEYHRPNGEVVYPLGKDPIGSLIYHSHFSPYGGRVAARLGSGVGRASCGPARAKLAHDPSDCNCTAAASIEQRRLISAVGGAMIARAGRNQLTARILRIPITEQEP
jgi:hypothetical protein